MRTIDLSLYAITDRRWLKPGQTLAEAVEKAIIGGATIIQFREKTLEGLELEKEAISVQRVCRQYGIPFIVNDDVMLAKKIDADGVHVGQSDMELAKARELLGQDKIIGVTAKTIELAQAAEAGGATYLGSGAVFGTSTKADAKPMDLDFFREICECVRIPVVAIGGIDETNIHRLWDCGMSGYALVSAVFAKEDIEAATRNLRQIIDYKPIVHCITNQVTVNDCANILVAVGASPIMAHHILEVEEITANASALVCNLGATDDFDAMRKSVAVANSKGIPVVLDPVGVAASSYRREFAIELMSRFHVDCVRSNYSEAVAIVKGCGTANGLDNCMSKDGIDFDEIGEFARRFNCLFLMTGKVDYVVDNITGEVHLIDDYMGNSMLTRITGSGCMLSALIGVYLAHENSAEALIRVARLYRSCGELATLEAMKRNAGGMVFKGLLIDSLGNVLFPFKKTGGLVGY